VGRAPTGPDPRRLPTALSSAQGEPRRLHGHRERTPLAKASRHVRCRLSRRVVLVLRAQPGRSRALEASASEIPANVSGLACPFPHPVTVHSTSDRARSRVAAGCRSIERFNVIGEGRSRPIRVDHPPAGASRPGVSGAFVDGSHAVLCEWRGGEAGTPRRRAGRPIVIANPASDQRFRATIDEIVGAGSPIPSDLEATLRTTYPLAVVRRRELASESFEVWYVYRDGHWVGGHDAGP
jgi:hypothetical protein